MLYSLQGKIKKFRHAKSARRTVLDVLYKHALPPASQKVEDTRFLVLDCEMTGLNPQKNSLISLGWVEISGTKIKLSSARHTLIYSGEPVDRSAEIHGLYDNQVAGAASIGRALTSLAKHMEGKVVVFHHAPLDLAFLQNAARFNVGCPLHFAYVDTMAIESRRQKLQNRSGSLQLNAVCQKYGLPPALQHNALADARATAELFLAQCAHIGHLPQLRLRDLGIKCA